MTEYELEHKIANSVPHGELLAELAEECTELAQAALKYRRAAGMATANPTPTTEEEAYISMEEEMADVLTTMAVLYRAGFSYPAAEINYKLTRWAERIDNDNL